MAGQSVKRTAESQRSLIMSRISRPFHGLLALDAAFRSQRLIGGLFSLVRSADSSLSLFVQSYASPFRNRPCPPPRGTSALYER
jgi:hypothetical protein